MALVQPVEPGDGGLVVAVGGFGEPGEHDDVVVAVVGDPPAEGPEHSRADHEPGAMDLPVAVPLDRL